MRCVGGEGEQNEIRLGGAVLGWGREALALRRLP